MSPAGAGPARDARWTSSLGATFYDADGPARLRRRDVAYTLSAILNHEPPEITGPAESFPPALGRIVHRCLEKDAEERFQSARDLAFAVEALSLGSRNAAVPLEGRLHTRRHRLAAAAGAALLAGGGALGLALAPTFREKPALPTIQQLTFRRGRSLGTLHVRRKTVVYGAYWDGNPPEIFSTRLESRSRARSGAPGAAAAVSSRGARDPADEARRSLRVPTGTLARGVSSPVGASASEDVFADCRPTVESWRSCDASTALQLEYPTGTPSSGLWVLALRLLP
jgi:hypothetical protein